MDILLDFHNSDFYIKLDSFLNFLLNDYDGEINCKYNEFEYAANVLLKKTPIALTHYNNFIKNCNKPFLSYSHLINIIDDINNNYTTNKTYHFCVKVWTYIYH